MFYIVRIVGNDDPLLPYNQTDEIRPPLTYANLQLKLNHANDEKVGGLNLTVGSEWTDVLRSGLVGGRVMCISDVAYRTLESQRLGGPALNGFALSVFSSEFDYTGRPYQWFELPSFDFKDPTVVNHDASVLAWTRWNHPGQACGAHLPPGAYELMRHDPQRDGPIQKAFATPRGTKVDAAPGFIKGFSVRELVLADDSPALHEPIFRLGVRLFCTEAFRKEWCRRKFTGLAFRRLEATDVERRGKIVRVEGRYNAD